MPFTGSIVATMSAIHQPTAAELQTITDALRAMTDPWTPYSPTLSATGGGFSLGNGILSGSYWQSGKLFGGTVLLLIGSTTSLGSGAWNVTLPPAITLASGLQWEHLGGCTIRDFSGNITYDIGSTSAATTSITAATNTGTRLGPTVPIAFANGDQVTINFGGQTL